jgi:RNA polymerase nonessential primary-like sigma factor
VFKKRGRKPKKADESAPQISSMCRTDLEEKLKSLDGRSKLAKEIKKQLATMGEQRQPEPPRSLDSPGHPSSSTRSSRREKAHTASASKETPRNTPTFLSIPQSSIENLRVLSRSEECELVQVVKDYFALLELQSTLASKLKHTPSLLELAEASRYSPSTLQSLLRLGEEAKNVLIRHNLRLVKSLTMKYLSTNGSAVSYMDLVEAGVQGLVKAIQKFDLKRELKLSTYATWWIRQALGRAIHLESGLIRLPENDWSDTSILKTATRNLTFSLGRSPTDQELLSHLSWSRKRLIHIKTCMQVYSASSIIPMDGVTGGEDDRAVGERISTDLDDPNGEEGTMSSRATNAEQYAVEVLADQRFNHSLSTKLTQDEDIIVRLKLGLPLPSASKGKGTPSRVLGVGVGDVGAVSASSVSMKHVAETVGKNRETTRQLFMSGMKKLKQDKELMVLLGEIVEERSEPRKLARNSNSLRKNQN